MEETLDERQCDWREEATAALAAVIAKCLHLGLDRKDAKLLCWGCGVDIEDCNGGNK